VNEILAGGRAPNVEGLNLEAVAWSMKKGCGRQRSASDHQPSHLRGWRCLHAIKFMPLMLLPGDPELSVPWRKNSAH